MTRSKQIACSVLVMAATGLIGYSVFAQTAGRNAATEGKKIAAQLDRNNMTLAKAVAAAEQHSKGRAITVMSDLHGQDKLAVHVYCIVGDPPKIMVCHVDHATGTIRGMKEVKEFPITKPEHADDAHAPGRGHGGDGAQAPHRGAAATKTINDQTVDAACGACIYKMPGVTGCPLAVKIDGKAYLVEGAQWPNHDYCDRNCQAIVSGKIEGDPPKFVATKLEPKP